MITRLDVLKAIHDGPGDRLTNRTRAIAERVSNPVNVPRVATVLRSAWGAGMLTRSDDKLGSVGYRWMLTALGRERRDDDQG